MAHSETNNHISGKDVSLEQQPLPSTMVMVQASNALDTRLAVKHEPEEDPLGNHDAVAPSDNFVKHKMGPACIGEVFQIEFTRQEPNHPPAISPKIIEVFVEPDLPKQEMLDEELSSACCLSSRVAPRRVEIDSIDQPKTKCSMTHQLPIENLFNCNSTSAILFSLMSQVCTDIGENNVACKVCTEKFPDYECLKSHMRSHKGKKYICDTCKAGFTGSGNLKKHIRIHTGEKPFSCTFCAARFTEAGSLKKHTRTHTGERPFSCVTCKARFSDLRTLRGHIRTHTGEKPYVCTVCEAKFISSSNLNKHTRIHTGEKPYGCDACEAKFSNLYSLERHKRIHTGERPFRCEACEKKFANSGNLKKHVIRRHADKKPKTI